MVGDESASAASFGVIEVFGGPAVIDREDESPFQCRGDVLSPTVQRQIDLGGLPGRELDLKVV